MDAQLRATMARVDRVERASFVQLYELAAELGTGTASDGDVVAVWSTRDDDPGFSCIINLALSAQPEETVRRLETEARAGGAQVLGIDTHPDLDPGLTYDWFQRLGYELDCEECIWWRALEPFEPRPLPAGLELRRVEAADGTTFAGVLNVGFGYATEYARGAIFASAIEQPGWFHYLAYVDGVPAAAAAMFAFDGVADCFVASTLPEARGRGAQTALIQRRLADGAATGCTLATAQSVVTNASPRNFARQGFRPVYRRWIYGKQVI